MRSSACGWALWAFVLSLLGIVLHDIGLFWIAGASQSLGPAVVGIQALVAFIAVGLLMLSRKAIGSEWLR